MSEYVIFTDSCCDLPNNMVQDMQLEILPLSVHLDEDTYKNYLDEREISYKDFYALLPTIQNAKTSAVNQQDFMEAFEPVLQSGRDLIYIGFSSALSGTFSAGALAARELQEKYPERKVLAADSLAASLGQGMLVYNAWLKKQKGLSVEELCAWVEENRLQQAHLFTVDDLMQLKRGGRVSATTAVFGSLLSIKPIMHVDLEGRLTPIGKARGRKASLRQLFQRMQETVTNPEEQVIFISHGDSLDDAQYLGDMIKNELHVKDVIYNFVGPVIGAHTGQGVIALFYLGNER